jgi:cytidylate kinase
LHVRLVAPLEMRIDAMQRRLKVSHEHAARYVHAADAARRAFYHRYWPHEALDPESFTITLNAGALTVEKMVEALVPLVGATKPAAIGIEPAEAVAKR